MKAIGLLSRDRIEISDMTARLSASNKLNINHMLQCSKKNIAPQQPGSLKGESVRMICFMRLILLIAFPGHSRLTVR
jgi:hypothetical protein